MFLHFRNPLESGLTPNQIDNPLQSLRPLYSDVLSPSRLRDRVESGEYRQYGRSFLTEVHYQSSASNPKRTVEGWKYYATPYNFLDEEEPTAWMEVPGASEAELQTRLKLAYGWHGIGVWALAEANYKDIMNLSSLMNHHPMMTLAGANLALSYYLADEIESAYIVATHNANACAVFQNQMLRRSMTIAILCSMRISSLGSPDLDDLRRMTLDPFVLSNAQDVFDFLRIPERLSGMRHDVQKFKQLTEQAEMQF